MADVNEVGAVMQVFRDAAFSITGKQLGELGADSAFDALGIDSVDTIEIVVEMERKLELRFDDRDLGSVRTLGDVAALVARKRAPR